LLILAVAGTVSAQCQEAWWTPITSCDWEADYPYATDCHTALSWTTVGYMTWQNLTNVGGGPVTGVNYLDSHNQFSDIDTGITISDDFCIPTNAKYIRCHHAGGGACSYDCGLFLNLTNNTQIAQWSGNHDNNWYVAWYDISAHAGQEAHLYLNDQNGLVGFRWWAADNCTFLDASNNPLTWYPSTGFSPTPPIPSQGYLYPNSSSYGNNVTLSLFFSGGNLSIIDDVWFNNGTQSFMATNTSPTSWSYTYVIPDITYTDMNWTAFYNLTFASTVYSVGVVNNPLTISPFSSTWWSISYAFAPGYALQSSFTLSGFASGITEDCLIEITGAGEPFNTTVPCESASETIYMEGVGPWNATLYGIRNDTGDRVSQSIHRNFVFEQIVCNTSDDCPTFMFCQPQTEDYGFCEYRYNLKYRVDPESILFYWKAWVGTGLGIGNESTNRPDQHYFILYTEPVDNVEFGYTIAKDLGEFVPSGWNITAFDVHWPDIYVMMRNAADPCNPYVDGFGCVDAKVVKINSSDEIEWTFDFLYANNIIKSWGALSYSPELNRIEICCSNVDGRAYGLNADTGTEISHSYLGVSSLFGRDVEYVGSPFSASGCTYYNGYADRFSYVTINIDNEIRAVESGPGRNEDWAWGWPNQLLLARPNEGIGHGPCDLQVTCKEGLRYDWSDGMEYTAVEEYDGQIYTMCINSSTRDTKIVITNENDYPRSSTISEIKKIENINLSSDFDFPAMDFSVSETDGSTYFLRAYVNTSEPVDNFVFSPVVYLLDQSPVYGVVENITDRADNFNVPVIRVIPTVEETYGVFANGTCSFNNLYCPWYGYIRVNKPADLTDKTGLKAQSILVVSDVPIVDSSMHRDWTVKSSSYGLYGMSYPILALPWQTANNTGIDLHITEFIEKNSINEEFTKPAIELLWNSYDDYHSDWYWCKQATDSRIISGEDDYIHRFYYPNGLGTLPCGSYNLKVTVYNETMGIVPGWYERDILMSDNLRGQQDLTTWKIYSEDDDPYYYKEPPGGHYQVPEIKYNYTYKFLLTVYSWQIGPGDNWYPVEYADEENITIFGCLDAHYPRMCPDGYTCFANLTTNNRECIQSPNYRLSAKQLDWGTDNDVVRVLLNVTYLDNNTQVEQTCSNLPESDNERLIIYLRQREDEEYFTEIGRSNGTFVDQLPYFVEGTDDQYTHVTDSWTYRAIVSCKTVDSWVLTTFTMGECRNDSHCDAQYFCKTWPSDDVEWAPICERRGFNNTPCYRDHECVGGNCSADLLNDLIGDYPTDPPRNPWESGGGYLTSNKGICFGDYQICYIDDIPDTCPAGEVCMPFNNRQKDSIGYCQEPLTIGDDCIFNPPPGYMTHMTYACDAKWNGVLPSGYDDSDNWLPMTSWCDSSLVCSWHIDSELGPIGQCDRYSNPVYADQDGNCGPGGVEQWARCVDDQYCRRNPSTDAPECVSQKPFGESCDNDWECTTGQCMGVDYAPDSLVSMCQKICYTCDAECLDEDEYTSCNWDFTVNPSPPNDIVSREGFCDVYNERCSNRICYDRVSLCDAYYDRGLAGNEQFCPSCDRSWDCAVGLECEYLDDFGYKACVFPRIYCNADDDCNKFTEYCNYELGEEGYRGLCTPRKDDGKACVREYINEDQLCQMGEYCDEGVCEGLNPSNNTLGVVHSPRKEGDTCYYVEAPRGWNENDMFIMSDDYEFGSCTYINCSATGELHDSGTTDDDTSCGDVVGDRAPYYVFCVGDPNLVHRISGAGTVEESNVYRWETSEGIDHLQSGYCMWKSEVGEPCYADVQCMTGSCVGERKSKKGALDYECTCNETECDTCSSDDGEYEFQYKAHSVYEYLHSVPNSAFGLDCICDDANCWSNTSSTCRRLNTEFAAGRHIPQNMQEYKDLILFETGVNCTLSNESDTAEELLDCQYIGPSQCPKPDDWLDAFNVEHTYTYGNPACGLPRNETDYDSRLTTVYNVSYITAGKCAGVECDSSYGEAVEGERECPKSVPVCNLDTGYCEPSNVEISLVPNNGIKLSRSVEGEFMQSCSRPDDGFYTIKTNGVPLILTWVASTRDGEKREDITTVAVSETQAEIDLCEFLGDGYNTDANDDYEVVNLYIRGVNPNDMRTYDSRVYKVRVVQSEFDFSFFDCRYKSADDVPYCNISINDGATVCSSSYDIVIRADAPIDECMARVGKDARNWTDRNISYMLSSKYNTDHSAQLGICSNFGEMRANVDKEIGDAYTVVLHNIRDYSYITVRCTDEMNVTLEKTYARNPVKYATSYEFTYEQQVFLMLIVFLLVPALILLFSRGGRF